MTQNSSSIFVAAGDITVKPSVGCWCNEDTSARDSGDVTTLLISGHTLQTRDERNVKKKKQKRTAALPYKMNNCVN